MHVRAIARTYVRLHARTHTHSIANSTRKRTQAHANKRTQTIAAIDAWAISACKRDCILRVGSKTFRMYYIYIRGRNYVWTLVNFVSFYLEICALTI